MNTPPYIARKPGEDVPKEVYEAIFGPPKPPRPPPRTLWDNLQPGMTDTAPPLEPLKKPEPLVLIKPRQPDEEIPAFGKVTRVMLGDLALLLSGGLLARLIETFPDINPTSWSSFLGVLTNDRNCFFRKTERAIAMAVVTSDGFTRTSYVRLVFLFHQDRGPEGGSVGNSQGEKEAIQLLRELRLWAKQIGASEISGLNHNADIPPSVISNYLRGTQMREDMVLDP